MKKIEVRKGIFALVDDEDYESIKHYRWCLFRCKGQADYACRYLRNSGKQIKVFMHRQVMPHDLPHTDHIDGDGLNNQKSNLRPAYCYQNVANTGPRKNNTSGLKGIYLIKSTNKWRVQVRSKKLGRRVHIGVFTDKLEAARAYDKAAVENYGEFAVTNFPITKQTTETTTEE